MTQIDSNRHAFGLDFERYSSSADGKKMMDFKIAALHDDPPISFMICRSGISWGHQDMWFNYNWTGIRQMDLFRIAAGVRTYPVGRGAYHVIYPSQNPISQADNFMRIVDPAADWEHDRAVIDLELNQGMTKRTITDCTKRFAEQVKKTTGRYPILYCRAQWLNQFAYPQELTFLELWLAQYLWPRPWPLFTPEYPPPPNPLPTGFTNWLVHQTGDRCKPIGSPVKKVMDYNRWNGGRR